MGILSRLFGCAQDVDENGNAYLGRPYYDSLPTGGKELEEFLAIGGTFIMPATNATHFYMEVKIVYGQLPEDTARYFALKANSSAARGEISCAFLAELVGQYSGKSWHDLCGRYAWEWSRIVGGIGPDDISCQEKRDADIKLCDAIRRAERFIMNGNRRFEPQLRSMPQSAVMQLLMEYQTCQDHIRGGYTA